MGRVIFSLFMIEKREKVPIFLGFASGLSLFARMIDLVHMESDFRSNLESTMKASTC